MALDQGPQGLPSPFNTTGLPAKLAEILKDHFEAHYPNEDEWIHLESLLMRGSILDTQGKVPFVAIRKKPDLHKIVFAGRGSNQFVYGYDGLMAWQFVAGQDEKPAPMAPAAAKNFILSSIFGSHLLYPSAPKKSIQLLGEEIINNKACYLIEVVTAGVPAVQYGISKYDFREVCIRSINEVTGELEELLQSDFLRILGMSLPQTGVLYVGDKLHAEFTIEEIKPNLGVMPWMFRPASEDYTCSFNSVKFD